MNPPTTFYFFAAILCILCLIFSNYLTRWIISQSEKWLILDDPQLALDRKSQKRPIPLLGGLSFIMTCGLATILVWLSQKFNFFNLQDYLGQNLEHPFKMIWIIIGGLILTIGGILDDKFTFNTKWLALFVFSGMLVSVFGGGLAIEAFSFPFDKILPQNSIVGSLLAFIWIGLCISATKFLDGHDGLVSSIGVLNLIVIAIVASFTNINQPLITLLAVIWASGILGFLPFNLPDAKIYLGESASEIIGFIIGVLSILSGAKVATTTGIIGWFVFDLLLVIYLRRTAGKSIFTAGREHWHFRLLDGGLNKNQVLVLTLIIMVISSGFSLFLPTAYKLFSIIAQFLILIIIFIITKKTSNSKKF
jgi:UDP-GlcNAc:undecaprenyl-phosphate/decaprenyl-phosphate GlcNAc-1-phosphate transferase